MKDRKNNMWDHTTLIEKKKLVKYLKTRTNFITDVHSLWSETKEYYKSQLIEMGGCYASFGNDITVSLNYHNIGFKFKVTLEEILK